VSGIRLPPFYQAETRARPAAPGKIEIDFYE
jgi:hypothetical protein